MQLRLDVKTLIVGIVLGVIITAAIGAGVGSADATRFGIAVQNKGAALVRTSNGNLFIVEPPSTKARLVLYESGRNKGKALSVSGTDRARKSSAK